MLFLNEIYFAFWQILPVDLQIDWFPHGRDMILTDIAFSNVFYIYIKVIHSVKNQREQVVMKSSRPWSTFSRLIPPLQEKLLSTLGISSGIYHNSSK